MPQRKNSMVRVETPEMQGEGSYMLLRRITWGRVQEALSIYNKAGQGADKQQSAAFQQEDMSYTKGIIEQSVAEWNWVDDEGNLMPLPCNGGIQHLSVDEVQFLLKKIMSPSQEEPKN